MQRQDARRDAIYCTRLGYSLDLVYCEDDKVAALLLALHKLKPWVRDKKVAELLGMVV